MKNRDWNRERRERETQNEDDWDWYYYEYRYVPYDYERGNYGDRNRNRREYGDLDYYQGHYGNRGGYGRERDYGYRSDPYSDDWTQGPYSGVGPRGYRRTDDRIKDDVNDRLTWHGYVDATDINVEVKDGMVTLSGEVNTRREKRMAEDAAESVSGVEDVHNQLRVKQTGRYFGESAMNRDIRPGMEVIGREGESVGEVKEVRSNDFLVDRAMARDIYIPFNACQIRNGQIHLSVRSDEVDDQGWEMPDLFETETETTQRSQKSR